MKTTNEINQLWICPKCNRQFTKQNQSHSCKIYPLEKHFEGKIIGQRLFEKLIDALKKHLGEFYVDSVECCIHLCTQSTFAAVKVLKDKIRLEFALPFDVKSQRFINGVQLSAHRFLYFVDIQKESEINDELIIWLKKAYEVKQKHVKLATIEK